MKINTTYECEICGKVFKKKEDALACERKHPRPVWMLRCSFEGRMGEQHPKFIEVEFAGGSKRVYELYGRFCSDSPNVESWTPAELFKEAPDVEHT